MQEQTNGGVVEEVGKRGGRGTKTEIADVDAGTDAGTEGASEDEEEYVAH